MCIILYNLSIGWNRKSFYGFMCVTITYKTIIQGDPKKGTLQKFNKFENFQDIVPILFQLVYQYNSSLCRKYGAKNWLFMHQ